MLPKSLEKLLQQSEYPPQRPSTMQSLTNRFVMKVDNLSPTPFSLVRRAVSSQDWIKNSSESAMNFDPILQLTQECRRVLTAMEETTNQPSRPYGRKQPNTIGELDWSRFEDFGFSDDAFDESIPYKVSTRRGGPSSPTNSAIVSTNPAQQDLPLFMTPPKRTMITEFDFDETFWWVWMTSQAQEETPARREVFGGCVVIQASLRIGRWVVLEERLEREEDPATISFQSADGPLPPRGEKAGGSLSKTWARMWDRK